MTGAQGIQGATGAAGATGATGAPISFQGTWSSITSYSVGDGAHIAARRGSHLRGTSTLFPAAMVRYGRC